MKYVFETDDKQEAELMLKALNMAIVLFEFSHNAMRKFKHMETEPTADMLMEEFYRLLEEQDIIVENLIQ